MDWILHISFYFELFLLFFIIHLFQLSILQSSILLVLTINIVFCHFLLVCLHGDRSKVLNFNIKLHLLLLTDIEVANLGKMTVFLPLNLLSISLVLKLTL